MRVMASVAPSEISKKNLENDQNALGFFESSFTTHMCLYPLPAAHPAIRPTSNPLPFFLRMNSAPGNTPTSSSQKSYVAFVALGDVVMRILGGTVGSSVDEKYEANGSAAMSCAVSSCAVEDDCPGSAVRNEGSNSRVLSRVRGTFSASRFYTPKLRTARCEKVVHELFWRPDRWPLPWPEPNVFATSAGPWPFWFS